VSLEVDHLLVRCLQVEHEPLSLDDPHLLPAGVPEGAALPVLAIPIVNQHVLNAVVLYGAHRNSTLPDPDEIELLHALAKAAATSHQQVRIAMLAREIAAHKARNDQLEATVAELRTILHHRVEGPARSAEVKGWPEPDPDAVATGPST
jgi:GAF domain-containing protein